MLGVLVAAVFGLVLTHGYVTHARCWLCSLVPTTICALDVRCRETCRVERLDYFLLFDWRLQLPECIINYVKGKGHPATSVATVTLG